MARAPSVNTIRSLKLSAVSVRDPRSVFQGGDGTRPQGHPDWGKPGPGVDKGSQRQRQDEDEKADKRYGGAADKITSRAPKPISRNNSQPGPGGPSGGAGRDTPEAGKGRSQFEKDRQGRMQGSGGGRPPIYKPNDDGERGGYKNRVSNAAKTARLMIDNGHFSY